MSNCLDGAITSVLGYTDKLLRAVVDDRISLVIIYHQLVAYFAPYIQVPLAHLGIDFHDVVWLFCVAAPFVLIVILPMILTFFFYCTCFMINAVRLKHRFMQVGHSHDWEKVARFVCALMWRTLGKIWHGYEIHGLEKLDPEKPAMLVYYHGEIPIDCYYLMAELVLEGNDKTKAVADRFLFSLPGWKTMLRVFNVVSGTREECESALNEGSYLVLAPGGTREMVYSDSNYSVHWGTRMGYAKVALKCKVPVYPVFTRNIREVFRFVRIWPFWNFQMYLYEKFKFPFGLLYGGFPSKLITFIGDPIRADLLTEIDVVELNERVKASLVSLIAEKQRVPGSILRAISERFSWGSSVNFG